jgi:RNA polymerase sigma-70 factor (ECF subfamily)
VPPAAIVALYDALVALQPTVGALVSRACALAEAEGPAAGLAALAAIPARDVDAYQPYWAALAHLARSAGDTDTAASARTRAVGLSSDAAVRRFLLAVE